jgi:CRP-like cAMP-binding protein
VFPVRAVLCLQAPHSDGCAVSFASVGREGCLGFDLLSASSCSQATAAIGGLAYLLPAPELRAEFERHGELAKQMIAHGNVLVAHAAILCACNRRHVLEQQLARWLLVMLDRSPGNELVATQEMIAGLLGVRREGVTEAARRLQDCGLIEYRRGRIFVRERAALAARACECYRAIRAQLEQLYAP